MLSATIDASVLYSAPLRDTILWLAVGQEWIRSVLRNRPDLKVHRLERTRDLMNEWVADCLVTGYEPLIDTLTLPDADDRHVLAAAIHGNASVIVTRNIRHFPNSLLQAYQVVAQHPDDFLFNLLSTETEAALIWLARQRSGLNNPPRSVDQYIEGFVIAKLPKTAELLRQHTNKL